MEIDLQQARAHFARLIERAMDGEEITIVHSGRAVVRMSPVGSDPAAADRDAADSEMADLFADALGG